MFSILIILARWRARKYTRSRVHAGTHCLPIIILKKAQKRIRGAISRPQTFSNNLF